MLKEQDKRAIETMILAGCGIDSLYEMFSKVNRSDIESVWENQKREESTVTFNGENIKMNCS